MNAKNIIHTVWVYTLLVATLIWPLALTAVTDDPRWLGVYIIYALIDFVVEFWRMR